MSTAQLTAVRPRLSADSWEPGSRAAGVPSGITLALLGLILYAAFAHGAVSTSVDTRIQLAIVALAVAGLVPWLWTGTLRVAAPRTVGLAVALLAGLALWSAITLLWSVTPDQTWLEVNRIITYALVLGLAVAVGASYARGLELAVVGYLIVACVVMAYALGHKLFPGLHIPGVFSLNQTSPLPRLEEPLGYWNALALFIAMAVPGALAMATDWKRSPGLRLAALCAVSLMLVTIVFTYSRGGLLALAIALVVAISLSGERLRSAVWLGAAVLAGVPAVVVGLTATALSSAGQRLSDRELAGAVLAAVLAVSLLVLVAGTRRLLAVETRLAIERHRVAGLRRLAATGVGVLVLAVVLALAFSSRGLTGSISHAWHTFTTTQPAPNYDPQRLLSADSQNRWVWWKEAAGAFSDRPFGGWGAGSFPVVHLLYRHDTLTVQQPHSVPLQFLAETGIVGAVLAFGAAVALLWTGLGVVRRLRAGPERLMAGAALSAGLLYFVHALYDWDWQIPAVTLPMLLLLGVLVSTRAREAHPAMRNGQVAPGRPSRLGLRALGLAGLALWLGVLALSIELPHLAANKAGAALLDASGATRADLAKAQASARQANALDPLSDAGLQAQATVAVHQGQLRSARAYLQQAVQRDPTDPQAWDQLSYIDLLVGDDAGGLEASRHVIALDPQGQVAQNLVRIRLLQTPPSASPTSTRTPPASP